MTPVLAKALIGVGISAVVVSSGGYGIYRLVTDPKTIKEKLVKEGLTLLNLSKTDTNSDSAEWNQKLTKYKEEGSAGSRFDDLPAKGSDASSVDVNKLKNSCEKALSMSLSDVKADATLKKAKQWCFKGTLETTAN